MCLCWCVLLKGLPSCKVSVLKESLKARRGCQWIINTCSLYNILHSRIRCANQAHLHSFPQISAWNVRCYQSVEALEFSFHSVWVTEACAKPLSWSAWFFFSVHVKYLHAFLQTHAEWSQQIHSCASKWLKENEGGGLVLSISVSDAPLSPRSTSKCTTGDQNPPTTTI